MKKKILIIKDSPDIMGILAFALENKNTSVIKAETGMEGMEHLKKKNIDLLILDMNLPDMRGREALKKIRKGNCSKKPCVLIFTAEALDFGEIEGLKKLGAQGVISTMSVKEIKQEVRKALNQKP